MKTLRKKTHFPYIKTILAFVLILLIVLGIILYIYPVKYVEIIDKYSKKYNISPELICAIINTESGFNKNEVSPKGAKVTEFARLEKGEGLEKKEENFAEEVAKQING